MAISAFVYDCSAASDTVVTCGSRVAAAETDWSNWFGGNVAAIVDIMKSAGFAAEHLESWHSRGSFRGVKNPATPREWEYGSYEGTHFKFNQDGTWTVTWHDPSKASKT